MENEWHETGREILIVIVTAFLSDGTMAQWRVELDVLKTEQFPL